MARVVRFARHGGPELLEIRDEAPTQPGAGELRIAVEAIGLNRSEIMFRSGHYVAAAAFPSRIGLEASGVIDALGPGVSGFAIGDRVAAVPYLSWDEWGNWTTDSVVKYGVYGESAIVPAFTVARNPDGLSAGPGGGDLVPVRDRLGRADRLRGARTFRHRAGYRGEQQRGARRVADREARRRDRHRGDAQGGQGGLPARGRRRPRGRDGGGRPRPMRQGNHRRPGLPLPHRENQGRGSMGARAGRERVSSINAAAARTRASPRGGPRICRPTGRPDSVKPAGTEADGRPSASTRR